MNKNLLVIPVALLVGIGGYELGTADNDVPQSSSATSAQPSETSIAQTGTPSAPTDSQAALAWSALMDPTGEYAAYAMYTAVIEKYGEVEPYVSIRDAELRHINALIRQLERYGITAPENPFLGQVDAPADLTAAATAWAIGEVDNVELYDQLIAQATDANLSKVFNNLRTASLDVHLPLFELAAENGGQLTADQMSANMHG